MKAGVHVARLMEYQTYNMDNLAMKAGRAFSFGWRNLCFHNTRELAVAELDFQMAAWQQEERFGFMLP